MDSTQIILDMNSSEEIAKRYAYSRVGFKLSEYKEVGLPVYKLIIQAFVLEYKRIPAIEEFVLNAINKGFTSEDSISKFLGLELSIVKPTLVNLMRSDDIYLSAPANSLEQMLTLSEKGKITFQESLSIVPEERTITIYFDGLLRKTRWYEDWQVIPPKKCKEAGLLEIPFLPSKLPQKDDLNIREINETFQFRRGNKANKKREILTIKTIEKRYTHFQPTLMLIYKAFEGNEIQISFAIDGRLSPEHEEAFARAGGVKKLGIEQGLQESEFEQMQMEDVLGKELIKQAIPPDDERVNAIREQESLAQTQLKEAIGKQEEATTKEERKAAEKQIELVSGEINKAASALLALAVRQLGVYEHPPLLKDAISNSKERLLIISPWIRARVVNKEFLRKLEELLKQGTKVFLGYGLGEKDQDMNDWDEEAEKKLTELSENYPNFAFQRIGHTHAKILVSDDKFVVVTSFNWLSYLGDRKRTFRDERGICVSLPQTIGDIFKTYIDSYFHTVT